MGQIREVLEAEGGGAALDRMGAAEDRVELLLVGRAAMSSARSCDSMLSRFSPASSKKTW
jgi:hypothetical protein